MWVFPLQSNQQKDQLLLAFELHQGTFNHHSFTNRTFRFARQYNGPTKPSPLPGPYTQTQSWIGFVLRDLHNYACQSARVEGLSTLDHRLKLELSASTCWNIGAQHITRLCLLEWNYEDLLTCLSSLISLWEILTDRNITSAPPCSALVCGGAAMWKKKRTERRTWQHWPLPRTSAVRSPTRHGWVAAGKPKLPCQPNSGPLQ